jgi:hypothetical protein
MGRQSNSGAGPLTHNLTFSHSRNRVITYDETEVEIEGRS